MRAEKTNLLPVQAAGKEEVDVGAAKEEADHRYPERNRKKEEI